MNAATMNRFGAQEAQIDNEGENVGQPTRPSESPAAEPRATRASLRLVSASRPRKVDPDTALVARAQAGDSASFGKLFDRHMGRITAMCTRMLKSRADVEDAVQQTFLEGWRCLHRFEGRSLFSTWMTRIAIHTCLGHRRKLKRLFLSDDFEAPPPTEATFSSTPVSPHEAMLHVRTRDAVDEILQKLSAKKRAAFVLAELEGMTAPEIASVLEIPEATVRTRLFHARKAFAKRAKSHPVLTEYYGDGDLVEKGGDHV